MAFDAREIARFGPAAVAIHDHGDVPREARQIDSLEQRLLDRARFGELGEVDHRRFVVILSRNDGEGSMRQMMQYIDGSFGVFAPQDDRSSRMLVPNLFEYQPFRRRSPSRRFEGSTDVDFAASDLDQTSCDPSNHVPQKAVRGDANRED